MAGALLRSTGSPQINVVCYLRERRGKGGHSVQLKLFPGEGCVSTAAESGCGDSGLE